MPSLLVCFNVFLMVSAITAAVVVIGAPSEDPDNSNNATRTAPKEEVHFLLYTTNNQLELTPATLQNVNPNLTTIMLIHGRLSGIETDANILNLTYAYRDLNTSNVIYVDWNRDAHYDEESDVYDTTRAIGESIGQMVLLLHGNGANIKSFHLIGQELGAHICGEAGRYVVGHHPKNATIRRITALDAAGPLFSPPLGGLVGNPSSLMSSDADIVDVTHTNEHYFGIANSIGTIDFIINGGQTQPFCGDIDNFGTVGQGLINECSHQFAAVLFQLTINSTQYRASTDADECEDLIIYGDKFDGKATGVYYVRTEDTYPFRSLC